MLQSITLLNISNVWGLKNSHTKLLPIKYSFEWAIWNESLRLSIHFMFGLQLQPFRNINRTRFIQLIRKEGGIFFLRFQLKLSTKSA